VRLIKRKDMLARSEKQAPPPSTENQLALTTQGWIEEFRAQKARDRRSLSGLIKRD